jgi:hypothetical protein
MKLRDLDDVLNNDVIGFLERPLLAEHFEWKASEPDAVLLGSLHLPNDWLLQNMFLEKLSGFRYFKADFKLRVQVNAQPFNAGLLLFVFIPYEDTMTETPSSQLDFQGLTGYRHALLDLSRDTACELTIPWSPLVSHADLVTGYGAMGRVKLYVYSPLTGADNVEGTIWITATNVEVALPTGLPVVVPTPVSTGPAHAGGHSMDGRAGPKTAKDQAGTVKPPKKPKGPISSIASTVSGVAGMFKNVPMIGPIADTVEWVGGAVSDVLDFFGFSKPADTSLPNKQTVVVANNFANYDGDCKTKSLAFSWANETEIPVEVFQETDDEMSFNHILARPTYLTRFKMNDNQGSSTIIWKWPVDPMSCLKVIHDDVTKTPYIPGRYLCANTYLSYLGSFFKFYRGSINYHFRIVKTIYHSGRIRVFVVPGATVDTDVNLIDFNKVHSSVFDIRDTNEFDITVPYKWNAPWKPLDGVFGVATASIENITPNKPTAMIYVAVINSLRNPSTAANSIDFVVETSAGEDFQFACPVVSTGTSLVYTAEQLRADYPAPTTYGELTAQGPAHAADTMLDNAGGDQLTANRIAIGEVVTGWRALLKRYSRWLPQTAVNDKFLTYPYSSALGGKITDPFDLYAAAELMYRFVSGGLRLGMRAIDTIQPVIVHEMEPYNSADASQDVSSSVLQSVYLEPLVELGIPFYQPTPGILTSVGKPKESRPSEPGTNYLEMPYNTGTVIRSSASSEVWRSTAEDFSFGYLLGPPQTLVSCQTVQVTCSDHWASTLDTKASYAYQFVNTRFAVALPRMTKAEVQPYFTERITEIYRAVLPTGLPDELATIQSNFATAMLAFDAASTDAEAKPIALAAFNAATSAMKAYFTTVCIKQ